MASGSLPWPPAQGCVPAPCWDAQWPLYVCAVCVNGPAQEVFCHSALSHSSTSLNAAGPSPGAARLSRTDKLWPPSTASLTTFAYFPNVSVPDSFSKLLRVGKYPRLPVSLRSPRVCAAHLPQRRLKAFLGFPCHHGLFNNNPNKVNNKSSALHRGPPRLLPPGLMNGAIRHASCPGGEQAAPAGRPGHRDGGGRRGDGGVGGG